MQRRGEEFCARQYSSSPNDLKKKKGKDELEPYSMEKELSYNRKNSSIRPEGPRKVKGLKNHLRREAIP